MFKSKRKVQIYIVGFIVFSLFLTVNSLLNTIAASDVYTVHRLTLNGSTVEISESIADDYSDFNQAYARMKEEAKSTPNMIVKSSNGKSKNQIVAADRAVAHSYPYRDGSKAKGKGTLDIYANASLGTAYTYITAHYNMYYYGTVMNSNRLVADVEINGARGYVEVDKTDIVPMIYVENRIAFELGGNENYYSNPEQSYSRIVEQEYYEVKKNGAYNEITVVSPRPHSSVSTVKSTYGIAPTWLNPGTYYSNDGISFYYDRELKNPVNNKKYYSYFLWLPVRSATNHDAASMNALLQRYNKTNSVILNQEDYFIEMGLKYGMNPIFIFSQANLESAYGTSKYAKERNNLFGWGAVDSNPDLAKYYDNIGEGIEVHMRAQLAGYMDIASPDFRHYGGSFGNKGSGISVKYASDPYYGNKVASLYYDLDKLNGYKDYNAYDLSILNDNTRYAVKKNASSTAGNWYTTKGGLKNQVIINLGLTNGYVKTHLLAPNDDTITHPGYFPMNLFTEFGYIQNSNISGIEASGPKAKTPTKPSNWTPPSKKVTFSNHPTQALITKASNIRDKYSTIGSKVIGSIKANTTVTIFKGSNGWAKITHDGVTGYIHADTLATYLKDSAIDDVIISDVSETAKVIKGDLRLRDSWSTNSEILTTIPNGTKLSPVYRTSNGWVQVSYNGYEGFVSAEFLEFLVEEEKVTVSTKAESATVKGSTSLNLRKEYNTNSTVLTSIAPGTKLTVYRTSNGWAKTTHNGHTGYVSLEYLDFSVPKPSEPTYKLGDVNNDGKIDGFDMMDIKRHYLGYKKLAGTQLLAADVNKDGKIDGFDMMDIKRHYLGYVIIKG